MDKLKKIMVLIWNYELPPQAQIARQLAGIWGFNLLVSLDQLLNVIFWGDPDQTISSRAGKARRMGKYWGFVMCSFLDLVDPGHCQRSIEKDEGKNSVMSIYKRRKEGAS